jgi:hypothetical protein
VIKRSEYIEGDVTHEEYYGQFVNDLVVNTVHAYIGEEKLLASKDPHLNDIPLEDWDMLPIVWDYKFLAETGETYRPQETHLGTQYFGPCKAFKVCVAKEAARRIIQQAKERS